MNLQLKIYSSLCATEIFSINGIDADYDDFGTKNDVGYDAEDYYCADMQFEGNDAEDYYCADMQFEGNLPTPEILNKYSITEDEFNEVVEKLQSGLSFGCCGLCS